MRLFYCLKLFAQQQNKEVSMNSAELESLEKALPEGFRLKWVPADLEGPAEIVINFPDVHLLQVASGRRFLGLLKRWEVIGYIEEFWPADPDSTIYIHQRHADQYENDVHNALKQSGLAEKVKIIVK